jgi:hypothetical protein
MSFIQYIALYLFIFIINISNLWLFTPLRRSIVAFLWILFRLNVFLGVCFHAFIFYFLVLSIFGVDDCTNRVIFWKLKVFMDIIRTFIYLIICFVSEGIMISEFTRASIVSLKTIFIYRKRCVKNNIIEIVFIIIMPIIFFIFMLTSLDLFLYLLIVLDIFWKKSF